MTIALSEHLESHIFTLEELLNLSNEIKSRPARSDKMHRRLVEIEWHADGEIGLAITLGLEAGTDEERMAYLERLLIARFKLCEDALHLLFGAEARRMHLMHLLVRHIRDEQWPERLIVYEQSVTDPFLSLYLWDRNQVAPWRRLIAAIIPGFSGTWEL